MRKLNRIVLASLAPVLTFVSSTPAHAEGLCDYWPFSQWRICQAQTGGGTVSVPEPAVLALFAAGMVTLGVVAILRRRRARAK